MSRKNCFCLLCVLIIGCFSFNALASDFAPSKEFVGKDGCFILYDLDAKKTVTHYNARQCAQRVFACSTFKIPLALMAFDQGILQDEDTVIKWDGVNRELDVWNHDQSPETWLEFSTVWVSQWITPQLGAKKIANYLKGFRYGNKDISGGITKFWLSSSLKISADEQLEFLRRLYWGSLPVSPRAMELVKKSIYAEYFDNGDIVYGKTGAGSFEEINPTDHRRVGWFIGYLFHDHKNYAFVTNFIDQAKLTAEITKKTGGSEAREITLAILKSFSSMPEGSKPSCNCSSLRTKNQF